MRVLISALILIPAMAAAQGVRESDRLLAANDLVDRLGGHVATFYDGSTAQYAASGDYSYRYTPDDPAFVGTYETASDSRICVTFENGFDRCDTYVEASGRLVLVTADGLRFPVKTLEPITR
ncbi:hypothetical protein CLV78_11031 [Aliiruegeria haliotis]|uniref:Uncharacterized protein n=1 Tax=Aliiruegeria haliotis TaxID=1280846 RepID=A0A2T0RJ32_9RHOB|nr:hypothetical protein [Aliiruegeria haliotis]PRY21158.1 hypothetical protein CLV78_11031 [Aliiruegeria haliotis]